MTEALRVKNLGENQKVRKCKKQVQKHYVECVH